MEFGTKVLVTISREKTVVKEIMIGRHERIELATDMERAEI